MNHRPRTLPGTGQKTYSVKGFVASYEYHDCPDCSGHEERHTVSYLVPADTEDEALEMVQEDIRVLGIVDVLEETGDEWKNLSVSLVGEDVLLRELGTAVAPILFKVDKCEVVCNQNV